MTRRAFPVRRLATGALFGGLAVVAVLAWGLRRAELPATLAIHFDAQGIPDGTAPAAWTAGLFCAGTIVAAVVAAVRTGRPDATTFAAVTASLSGLLAAASWMLVLANADAPDAAVARPPTGGLGVILGAAVLAGAVAAILGHRRAACSRRPPRIGW